MYSVIGVYLFKVLAGKGDDEEGAERLRSGGSKYWHAQFHDFSCFREKNSILVRSVFCDIYDENK